MTIPVVEGKAGSVTVDRVLDGLGLGRFQWKLLAICGLTWAADAMEVLLMGFAGAGRRSTGSGAPGAP